MSELKRHHINEVMDMHNLTRGKMGYSVVYYADDADKVIAHNKYKRCLAMARWCDDKSVSLYSIVENDLWKYTSRYWLRWRNKWLKLAEKFKESK